MRTAIIKLTPKKAQEFLNNRAPNRPISESTAQRFAGAIKDGQWKLNGETIKFNDLGQMEDGQHRCVGVIRAGIPIDTAVVYGLESNNGVFETIDGGYKRSLGHMLARAKEENYNRLGAALGWLWRWESGMVTAFCSPRRDQAMQLLKDHPDLRKSVHFVGQASKVMACGLAGFLHYLFSKKDKQLADVFFASLGSGEGLSKVSPETSGIYLLRETLLDDRSRRSRMHNYVIAAMTIKTWNCVRTKKVCKTIKSIRWSQHESFPIPE